MGCKKLLYFVLIECFLFFSFGSLAMCIGDEIWNIRALHFIIFQDCLFIIFSILPAMGHVFMSERVQIFNFHCSVIAVHTLNGIVLVITGKEKIDPQFFVSVACLVFIGCIFTVCVIIMLAIAYCSGDFEAIFDEQFLNIDGNASRGVRRLDEDFMEDFENINTLIYRKYIHLNNNACPICLCDYQEEEVLKILPGCYHTFHQECIKHWFKNQLKCPFCRVDITREQIEKDRDMNEDDLIKKIKCSESVMGSEFDKKSVMAHEVEVRMDSLPESVKDSEYGDEPNFSQFKNHLAIMQKIPQKNRRYSSKPGGGMNQRCNTNKMLNMTQKLVFQSNAGDSVETPGIGLGKKVSNVRKMEFEPSLKSYLIEENNSIKMKNKSIDGGHQKIIHDYFELSDDQDD